MPPPALTNESESDAAAAHGTKRPLELTSNVDGGGGGSGGDEDPDAKRRRILEETRDIDADSDPGSDGDDDDDGSDGDSSSDDDSDDDEDAELQRELEKIRRERAEKRAREEAEKAAREQEDKERDIAYGNPLLNPKQQQQDFNMKRRWDDDVVFKNQARGTENKGKSKEFINVSSPLPTNLLKLHTVLIRARAHRISYALISTSGS